MNKKLLVTTIFMLLACIILVSISYFYIDKTVAEFFYQNRSFSKSESWLGYLIKYSLLIGYAPPFIALFLLFKNNFRKFQDINEKKFLVISLSATLAISIKDILKLVFGRYWPSHWVGNNPLWLNSQQYGFNFFHSGASYNSFPSGHTTAIFAIMTVVWLAYPKWHWLCIVSCIGMMASLVFLDYHFVSDIIAGMFLGIIVGQNTAYYFFQKNN